MSRWIPLQVELGNFHQRRTIYIFALKASFLSVLLSLMVVVTALPVMSWLGILRLPLADCIRLGIMLSWLIGGTVSAILAVLTGYSIHEISVSRAEFERLSRTDTLSGLFNRRAFAESMAGADKDASLVIFDVDRFKSVNDRYGHAAGDAVIVAISGVLSKIFSEQAVVGRLGGEEFGVLLSGGSAEDRIARIEAAKVTVCNTSILIDCGAISVTISAGIADFTPVRSPEAVYAAADNALYLAKALGRNRVVHENERPHTVAHCSSLLDPDMTYMTAMPRPGFGAWETKRRVRIPVA
ncbi:GGDEF domain-containing protein [Rhizobium rhododendri]|uniref:diguanylate cyclase n=2 Tax=Rhizobium/Agrobacterium group TaxID=227290 RepID=A0ABY8IF67_9HYPH|nr:GGDEF domain-containing protein [Rhizobium rhododendri]